MARPVDQGPLDCRHGARLPDPMAHLDGAEAARSGRPQRSVRGGPAQPQSFRGSVPDSQARLERGGVLLQGRLLGVSLSLRGRHAVEGRAMDRDVRRAGRGCRWPRKEDFGGPQALPEASSTRVPGAFDQRRDGGVVRTGGNQRRAAEPPHTRRSPPRGTIQKGGRGGGTHDRVGPGHRLRAFDHDRPR